jgi:hypothetical protein
VNAWLEGNRGESAFSLKGTPDIIPKAMAKLLGMLGIAAMIRCL